MAVTVGAKAPDFTLRNQDMQDVTLSDLWKKGPLVLAFLPGAFSGTCTAEMCAFRDSADELRRLDATVVGVSVDTFFALKGWAVAEKIPFTLLSDFNKQVTPLYGVLNPDMIGLKNIAYRATFVIGRDGVVKYAQVLDDARNEPDYDAVKAALASA